MGTGDALFNTSSWGLHPHRERDKKSVNKPVINIKQIACQRVVSATEQSKLGREYRLRGIQLGQPEEAWKTSNRGLAYRRGRSKTAGSLEDGPCNRKTACKGLEGRVCLFSLSSVYPPFPHSAPCTQKSSYLQSWSSRGFHRRTRSMQSYCGI